MADDIPAGWYPDAHGTVRWWDGQHWTNHVREGSRATTAPPQPTAAEPVAPEPAAAAAIAPDPVAVAPTDADADATEAAVEPEATPEPVTATPTDARAAIPSWATTPASTSVMPAQSERHTAAQEVHRPRISYPPTADDEPEDDGDSGARRVWLTATAVGLATFFLGMGLGGQSAQPRQAPEPLPPAVATEPADIESLRQQLANRQAELDERQQVLDEREDDLDRRDSASPSPSPFPSDSAAPRATATTIDGDDTVQVGTDVREGTYRTSGPSDPDFECEYVISRDEFGDDVIAEDQVTSSTSVTLRDGDWFATDDCQDWTRE